MTSFNYPHQPFETPQDHRRRLWKAKRAVRLARRQGRTGRDIRLLYMAIMATPRMVDFPVEEVSVWPDQQLREMAGRWNAIQNRHRGKTQVVDQQGRLLRWE